MQEKTTQALQSFILGFNNSDISEVKKIIHEFKIGGLIFFAENISQLEQSSHRYSGE